MITINQNLHYSERGVGKKHFCQYIKNKKLYLLSKRFFDIIVSLFVIVFILTWLIPLLGIVIKLNSRGPVFFVQRRVGRGLRSFHCIKFRSMVVNCEAHRNSAKDDDQRITSLGKFLRTTSIDELPQFFNVLLGHMSIVGPRPHMFADCNRFSNYIQYYKSRAFVRPGITGLAQVKGFRGPAEDMHQIASRFTFDSLYIRHMGFRLDLMIMLLTVIQTFNSMLFKNKVRIMRFKRIKEDRKKVAA